MAFDGEFYLPLGRRGGRRRDPRDPGSPPRPTEAESRSLGGACGSCFRRSIARAFGADYHYPILAAAEVGEDSRSATSPTRTPSGPG